MKIRVAVALAVMVSVALTALGAAPADAQTASNTVDAHLAAAKRAAGFDFPGLLAALCVAPRNAPTPDVRPGPPPPDRARWYMEPAKVFDDVYFVGTKDRSSWALTTPDGIVLIEHDIRVRSRAGDRRRAEKARLRSRQREICHHFPCPSRRGRRGKLMQDRFGSRIVRGKGDWEMIEQSVNRFPNGKPKRDIVAMDGQKITLGDRTVTLVPMPGHTPGTVSIIFQVKDNGMPLMVAFSGGTEFNFVNDVPHFDTYINSARKFAAIAAAAGATVLMTNQSEFDNAASKIRMLAARSPGEPHPLEVGSDAVQRYFKVFDECAEVARLKLL